MLPSQVDLRDGLDMEGIEVYDQGELQSCTANAICTAWLHAQASIDAEFLPSRLFLYYNERLVQGQTSEDCGASISVGCQSLETYGLCSEDTWPYDPQMEPVQPPQEAYDEARYHKIHTAAQISDNIYHVKDSLAQGKPVVVGIVLYSEFMGQSARETGEIPLPGYGSQQQGNHAVLVVGYNDDEQRWICRNSWGWNWGDQGHFYLPYEYLTTEEHLASDFWNIATDYEEAPSRFNDDRPTLTDYNSGYDAPQYGGRYDGPTDFDDRDNSYDNEYDRGGYRDYY